MVMLLIYAPNVDGDTKIIHVLADNAKAANGEKNFEYVVTIPRTVTVKKGARVKKGDYAH
jgi:hypothetical protein